MIRFGLVVGRLLTTPVKGAKGNVTALLRTSGHSADRMRVGLVAGDAAAEKLVAFPRGAVVAVTGTLRPVRVLDSRGREIQSLRLSVHDAVGMAAEAGAEPAIDDFDDDGELD